MSATFHGLEVAKSGLTAAQIAVNTASQNIANANTEGYTRQTVLQNPVSAGLGPFQYVKPEPGVGLGVAVSAIAQNRDAYLDIRFRAAAGSYQTYATALSSMDSVRAVLDETDADGLNAVLGDYYSALQNLKNNPEGVEYASLMRTAGEKVSNVLNEYAFQLDQIKGELQHDLTLSVADVNTLLDKIDKLNVNIAVATLNKTDSNELSDARNLFLDKLSGYINITVINKPNGAVSIKSGAQTLLDAPAGAHMTLSVGTGAAGVAVLDGSGAELSFSDGSVKGLLRSINGAGAYAGAGEDAFVGVTYYQRALDDFAASFACAFNTLNASNGDLFVNAAGGPVTAAGVRISEDWRQNAAFIDLSQPTLACMLGAMDQDAAIGPCFTGTFEEHASLLMTGAGLDVSYLQDMTASKNAILQAIEDDRESVMGISIDEETVNTIKYQKAYQAAARVMSALDEMLETLINQMAV